MRGQTFGKVVQMAREEAGQSSNAAVGRNVTDIFEQFVRRTYERLHQDFDWLHLFRRDDKILEAGKRFYGFPDELDPDRLAGVYVLEEKGFHWREVTYGVGPAEWNRYDPRQDERSDPVRAWERTGQGFIEVWPLPESPQTLRFEGMPVPSPLAQRQDVVDLDANLVALFAAGEWLAKQGANDTQMKLQQAQQLYERLKGHQQQASPTFQMNTIRRGDAQRGHQIVVRAPRT